MLSNIILLGNGINRIKHSNSWELLLCSLIEQSGLNITQKDKPFPLLYEEILLKTLKNTNNKERSLLQKIVESVNSIETNKYHYACSQLTDEIITTNYDYKLEESLLSINQQKHIPKSLTRERLYSLFRCIKIDNKIIWHIHGEINNIESICLGYERYGANIQKIRNFIISGDEKKDILPLKKRLIRQENLGVSWVDKFFTNDISIIGLGLNFHEIDLWWILDFRAREKYTGNKEINNKITYYCPIGEDKARIQVLEALGVITREISFEQQKNQNEANYDIFYKKVFDEFNRN